MPIFEGFLPPNHEKVVMDLLYLSATVHALSKLRMHTDATLTSLHESIIRFGDAIRRFKTYTCDSFATEETTHEYEKRMRRVAREQATQGNAMVRDPDPRTRLAKTFNLNTIKLHSIGDYVRTIMRLGTTDSYSTAIVRYAITDDFYNSTCIRARWATNELRISINVQINEIRQSRWPNLIRDC